MGERGDALRLEGVEHGEQLVHIRRLLAAGLVEGSLVQPQPVGGVNVDGGSNPVAIILGKRLQRFRNDLVPAFLGGEIVKIGGNAHLGPVAQVEAEQLDGGRRIAGGHTGAQRRHRGRTGTTGNRHVFPADTLLGQVFLEHVERRGFAAGRPPVQNFNLFGCLCGASGQRNHSRTGGQFADQTNSH